jgi:YfiH family protein
MISHRNGGAGGDQVEPFVVAEKSHTIHLREWENSFPQLAAGFTLRTGGTSEEPFASLNLGLHVGDVPKNVVANRQLLSRRLGMPFAAWTCADQVHGKNVCRVTAAHRGAGRENIADSLPATDGLHTNEAGILLASFYADCVPLYFLDPHNRAIGLAHAGWRGTVARIACEMVKSFGEHYGSKPDELLVAIGPSIRGCCYEVDERIIAEVRASAKSWQQAVTAQANGKYLLDLAELNRLILQEAGVSGERISLSQWCTSCRTDMFFSHRKEAGKTGRMASFIGWRQEGAGKRNG